MQQVAGLSDGHHHHLIASQAPTRGYHGRVVDLWSRRRHGEQRRPDFSLVAGWAAGRRLPLRSSTDTLERLTGAIEGSSGWWLEGGTVERVEREWWTAKLAAAESSDRAQKADRDAVIVEVDDYAVRATARRLLAAATGEPGERLMRVRFGRLPQRFCERARPIAPTATGQRRPG
jgi:hypothetical protein